MIGVATEQPDFTRQPGVQPHATPLASVPYIIPSLCGHGAGSYWGSKDPSYRVPRTEMTDSKNAGNISGMFRPSLLAAAKNSIFPSLTFSASTMASLIEATSSGKPKDIDTISTS